MTRHNLRTLNEMYEINKHSNKHRATDETTVKLIMRTESSNVGPTNGVRYMDKWN